MKIEHIAIAAAASLLAYLVTRNVGTIGAAELASQISGIIQGKGMDIMKAVSGWNTNLVPTQYRAAISNAEATNGIPQSLLARLLYQESHYRQDIISGATKSRVGAIGIAQFMPGTAPDWSVNLYDGDPFDDIAGAGRYLAWLYRQTGAWDKALAAYNWGIGNVQRKGLASAPSETRTYYSSILADVGLA